MTITPIGVIRSPFHTKGETPIQPYKTRRMGTVVVHKKYEQGLRDIERFSHIILIYRFHRSRGYRLLVTPFLDEKVRGLFATRYPRRPNQLGLSVVRLLRRRGNRLTVKGIDVLDGTPLLDIKPYVPAFSGGTRARIAWLKGKV